MKSFPRAPDRPGKIPFRDKFPGAGADTRILPRQSPRRITARTIARAAKFEPREPAGIVSNEFFARMAAIRCSTNFTASSNETSALD